MRASYLFSSLFLSASFLLAGCLPSSGSVDEQVSSVTSPQNFGKNTANTLVNGGVAIAAQVVSSASAGTTLTEGPVGSATLNAAVAGPAANQISAAVCGINSAAYLVTWVKSSSGSTEVAGQIAGKLPGSDYGYGHGATLKLADGSVKDLSGACKNLSIPDGAPVVLSRLGSTTAGNKAIALSRIETRQLPCGDGEKGVVLQKRVVTIGGENPDAETSTAWATELDRCETTPEVAEVAVTHGKVDIAGNYGNVESPDSQSLMRDLYSQIGSMDCTTATVGVNKNTETKTDRIYSSQNGGTVAGNGYTGKITNCASVASIHASTPAADLKETDKIEQFREVPCTGKTSTETATLGAFTGSVSNSAWSGVAKFVRYAPVYSDGTSTTNVKNVAWHPYSLSCERNDTMVLKCDDIKPAALGTLTALGDNADLTYIRTLKIDGYKDTTTLAPADPVVSWKLASGQCRWTKKETVTPSCAATEIPMDGEAEQIVVADAENAAGYTLGALNITKAGTCASGMNCAAPFEVTSKNIQVTKIADYTWGIGKNGDATWDSGNGCSVITSEVTFNIADPSDVEEFRITRQKYDDHLWVAVNPDLYPHGQYIGPEGGSGPLNFVARNGMRKGRGIVSYNGVNKSCELGKSRDYYNNIDLKPYLRAGENKILIKTGVGGTGEMYTVFRLKTKHCTQKDFNLKLNVSDGDQARVGFDLKTGKAWINSASGVINRVLYYNVPKLDYDRICANPDSLIESKSLGIWNISNADTTINRTLTQVPSCANGLVGEIYLRDQTFGPSAKWKLTAEQVFTLSPVPAGPDPVVYGADEGVRF